MNFRLSLLATAAVIAIGASGTQQASASTCPTIGADTDCGVIITLNADGTTTISTTGQGPYDGIEDTLVGVVNNSGHDIGSITLSSTTNIFGFDGDGIGGSYGGGSNPSDSTGYGGPMSFFSNITPSGGSCASSTCAVITPFSTTGDVNFLGGLAAGASTYFALEENLSEASFTVPTTAGVPEPASLALLGGGLAALGMLRRRKKA